MKRRVHYVPQGGLGGFACYREEINRWSDSAQVIPNPRYPGSTTVVHAYPQPRRHTDLRKVTCRACWQSIREMAKGVL